MFGQQNDKHDEEAKIPDDSINGALADDDDTPVTPDPSSEPSEDNHEAPASDEQQWQHPGAPLDDKPADDTPSAPPNPMSDIIAPDSGSAAPNGFPSPKPSNPATSVHASSPSSDDAPDDLIDIKQKALGQLSPLVNHLDQSPEDKFRTMMMVIQASDDQSLVRAAYDAAQKIEDEKVRAQALLDVVNEINYFTQHHDQ